METFRRKVQFLSKLILKIFGLLNEKSSFKIIKLYYKATSIHVFFKYHTFCIRNANDDNEKIRYTERVEK